MYSIITDTASNIERELLEKHDIMVMPLSFCFEGEAEYVMTDDFNGKAYYDEMRRGRKVTTSQITPQAYIDYMSPILTAGEDILFIGISSGISGSYASAEIAARQLKEDFPMRQVFTVDTLGASLGEGLLVIEAANNRSNGMSIEENAASITELRHSMCQVFTVDDLKNLQMTGRLTGLQTLIGTVLGVKPVLIGNSKGQIVCSAKVRGRKKAILTLAEQYEKWVGSPEAQTVGIAHADCPDDAAYLSDLLMKSKPPKEIYTVCYEPVTGAHVGPGTLALFFMGDSGFRG